MQIVIAILAFCVIIIIHELGHFTAAKLCGIQVNEFAVGMGPVILRKKGRETNYVIRLLPIGGSVSMEGEQDSSDNPRAFNRKPVWQRMIVILAGPIMNLILGFFVAMIYVCTISNIETTTVSVVNDIPGITSQLMVGDEIVSVENTTVWTTFDIQYKMQNNGGRTDENGNLLLDFKVKRGRRAYRAERRSVQGRNRRITGNSDVIYSFYVQPLERNFLTGY